MNWPEEHKKEPILWYFWGKGEDFIWYVMSGGVESKEAGLLLKGMRLRFLNGEGRETILADLGLPSVFQLSSTRKEILEDLDLSANWVIDFSRDPKEGEFKKIEVLVSMIEKGYTAPH